MTKLRAACLASVAVLTGACGVPMDGRPRVIPRQEVPFDLLRPSQPPRPASAAPGQGVSVQVFFARGDRLAPVPRATATASVQEVVRHLLLGPRGEEAEGGVRSALGPRTRVLSARVEDRVAVIDLSSDFAEVRGEEQVLAVAQVVYSVTGVVGVDGVRLLLEGRAVEVPTGEGTLTERPLARADFARFSPG